MAEKDNRQKPRQKPASEIRNKQNPVGNKPSSPQTAPPIRKPTK